MGYRYKYSKMETCTADITRTFIKDYRWRGKIDVVILYCYTKTKYDILLNKFRYSRNTTNKRPDPMHHHPETMLA